MTNYRKLIRSAIIIKLLSLFGVTVMLQSCATTRPHQIHNTCAIYEQYPEWHWHTKKTQHKWGVPENVQMAIIYHESQFIAEARPPRKTLFGIIPWKRQSTAHGYAQALNQTWEEYQDSTGNNSGKRNKFVDAVDFIGWFAKQAHIKAKIPYNDAYRMYLAYHEGIGGYLNKSYLKKPWLIKVAKNVQKRATIYKSQLSVCSAKLPLPPYSSGF